MVNGIFQGLFHGSYGNDISPFLFLSCIAAALLIGFLTASMYRVRNCFSRSYLITLAMLPAVVCVVILIVNGNVGTGIAVAGTFSLVRFRSVPGTAEEIGGLFLAMGAGLILGAGYIAYAFLFVVFVGGISVLYRVSSWSRKHPGNGQMVLHVTVPEDLNGTDIFDRILHKYTSAYELVTIKTTNMGSLFRLTYHVILKNGGHEKELIDSLRCANGNLEILLSRQSTGALEL